MSAQGTLSIRERWTNRELFRLIWPLVIEQLLAVTMGAADTLMVSSAGEFAVSGVNIIDNINNLLIIAFIAMSTGGAVVCSQYIGRQDFENARTASRQLVYMVTLISVVTTVLALFFRRPVIEILYGKIEEDVMNAAMTYFLITGLSYPFLALYNSCAALYRSAGNSKVPMNIALMVNVINVGGNAFLLFVVRMGVAGVALSTLLSRIAAAAILLILLIGKKNSPVSLSGILKIQLILPMIKRILHIGIPSGLEQSMFQVGRLLTQRIFPVFGTAFIAANAVAGTINSFGFMTGGAFNIAVLTVVGQCIGAGDYDAAKKYAAKIIRFTWATIIIISALLFIFRSQLVDIFKLSREAADAAKSFLAVHTVSSALVWTLSFTVPCALRAAGDANYAMIVGAISMWVVRVCFSYLLTFGFGIGPLGVWIAQGGDFIVRGILYSIRWKRGRWQKIKLLDS